MEPPFWWGGVIKTGPRDHEWGAWETSVAAAADTSEAGTWDIFRYTLHRFGPIVTAYLQMPPRLTHPHRGLGQADF